jgi:hypothetical protein
MTAIILRLLWKPFAALLALLAVFGAGRASRKVNDLENEVQGHEIRNEVENRIARDGNSRERLREKWLRR